MFYAHKERNMIELMRQMVILLPIKELKKGEQLLLLKGKYKIPSSFKDMINQFKY